MNNLVLCTETASYCLFELDTIPAGMTSCNEDKKINYLVFCQKGHISITSTLFHDGILCAGEAMFVPRESECSGTALSDTTLLVHISSTTPSAVQRSVFYRTSTPTAMDYQTNQIYGWISCKFIHFLYLCIHEQGTLRATNMLRNQKQSAEYITLQIR